MALKGKNIIMLGITKFDSPIESTNYTVARHLAKDNRVFYIDNPYTWRDCISYRKTSGFQRRKDYFSFKPVDILDTDTPNLKIVITPPLMSINWMPEGKIYRSMLNINEKIILHRIRQVIAKYDISDFIYINSFNFYYPGIARKLAPDLTIYHCVDPLAFGYEKRHGLISEHKIVSESDLIICTSKQLYEEKKKVNNNTFFIPNAADIAHCSKALLEEVPVHKSLENIPKPIIGYFGNIERRMDYDLLKTVIELNTDKSFVFAGPMLEEYVPKWMFETPNVYLTGAVPYADMPAVLKGFDVSMIPFKKDEFSATIFPLKLFEYLGAGKPVIATDFNPDLKEYTAEAVTYCSDATSFSAAISKALKEQDDKVKEHRLAVASQNTWEIRVAEFSKLINKYLCKERRLETA
jgi:teichuronic acid biosynthesis glycosyltransferase TuaH